MFKTAIILAGGQSSRMGFDKQFLFLEEERLMKSVIEQLSVIFDDFIIVTNKPSAYDDFDVLVTEDQYRNKGPLAGIHAGLLASKSQYSFVLACDMPHLSVPLIRHQQNILSGGDYVALISETPEKLLNPFHGFYSKSLIKELERVLENGDLSVQSFLDDQSVYYMKYQNIKRFVDPELLFTNLNTPEDLKKFVKNKGGEKNRKCETSRYRLRSDFITR